MPLDICRVETVNRESLCVRDANEARWPYADEDERFGSPGQENDAPCPTL